VIRDSVSRVFKFIGQRSYAYKWAFRKEEAAAQLVLRDLAKFCRAHRSTYHSDPRMQAVLEGRREVWLRIQEFLNLSDQQLFDLHQIKYVEPLSKGDKNV
jgi:hypothetical protein